MNNDVKGGSVFQGLNNTIEKPVDKRAITEYNANAKRSDVCVELFRSFKVALFKNLCAMVHKRL